jgi:prepilin-type processing-associated H-X9-DG protein
MNGVKATSRGISPSSALRHLQRISALTRMDVLVSLMVIFMLTVAIGELAPKPGYKRGNCITRLRGLGVALSDYAHDNREKFPWQVSTNEGGSWEYASLLFSVYRHYLAASNYTSAPSLLVCPQDERNPALSWTSMRDSDLSYFVNLSAPPRGKGSALAGDRYLTTNSTMLHGFLDVRTRTKVRWTAKFHDGTGNLLFSDGSVRDHSPNFVRQFFSGAVESTNRLAIP